MAKLINDTKVLGNTVVTIGKNGNFDKVVTFDKMIEAIHKVQEQMKITGTTSKEASTTIEGSAGSMKASWQNLLTGMAGGGGDFNKLVENFTKSLQGYLSNVMPKISKIVTGMIKAVNSLLPELLKTVSETLVSNAPQILQGVQSLVLAVADFLPSIVPILKAVIPSIVDTMQELIPKLLDMGKNGFKALVSGFSSERISEAGTFIIDFVSDMAQQLIDSLPILADGAITLIDNLLASLPDLLPQLLEKVLSLATQLVEKLGEIIPQLAEKIPVWIEQISTALVNSSPTLMEGAGKLFSALLKALPPILLSLGKLLIQLPQTLFKYLTDPEFYTKLFEGAKLGFKALKDGMGDIIPQVKNTLSNGLNAVVEFIKNKATDIANGVLFIVLKVKEIALGLKDKFTEIGLNIIKGIVNGMLGAKTWMENKIKGLISGITGFIKKLLGIHSPSTVMEDEIGDNMALGIGKGFIKTMGAVSKQMQDAIPTSFDVESTLKTNKSENMVNQFKEAMSGMEVVLDGDKVGEFATEAVANAIYA